MRRFKTFFTSFLDPILLLIDFKDIRLSTSSIIDQSEVIMIWTNQKSLWFRPMRWLGSNLNWVLFTEQVDRADISLFKFNFGIFWISSSISSKSTSWSSSCFSFISSFSSSDGTDSISFSFSLRQVSGIKILNNMVGWITQSAYHVFIPLTSLSSWLEDPIVQSNGSSLAPPSKHQFVTCFSTVLRAISMIRFKIFKMKSSWVISDESSSDNPRVQLVARELIVRVSTIEWVSADSFSRVPFSESNDSCVWVIFDESFWSESTENLSNAPWNSSEILLRLSNWQ